MICHFHTRAISRWRKARCFIHTWVEYYLWPNKIGPHCSCSLSKQPTFGDATTGFPAKWRLRNERRNSILMMQHYPDIIVISVEFLHSFLRYHFTGIGCVAEYRLFSQAIAHALFVPRLADNVLGSQVMKLKLNFHLMMLFFCCYESWKWATFAVAQRKP